MDAGTAELLVRPVRNGDAEALAGVTARAYAATYPGIVPAEVLGEWIAEAPANWRKALPSFVDRDDPARAWVAERGSGIIGYATTAPGKDWWLPPPAGAGELTNLYLDPDAMGTGTGRRLYEAATADLRSRGFNPFVVWAFRDNVRAVRFYERMGCSIDGPDHLWELGGVPCPIVRLRLDWRAAPGA
jgi:GNAT superfamily N-acetyltransferase